MQWKDVWIGIGNFMEWTFEILPPLSNIPNAIFLAIGSIMFLYWLGQMVKHNRAGEQ